jgi:hypothetical protein
MDIGKGGKFLYGILKKKIFLFIHPKMMRLALKTSKPAQTGI